MYCRSSDVKRSGKSRHGRQRWYCHRCYRTYSWRLSSSKASRRFSWFKRWIVEGYSVRELARLSCVSVPTVRRSIVYWLNHPPALPVPSVSVKHIIVDGTYLHRSCGIYAAMNAEDHRLITARYDLREGARELLVFYAQLAHEGLMPESATIDGNRQQMKYLRVVWPSIQLQRCVVHVQRQGLSWCRQKPKRTDAKHLRQLFLQLPKVQTKHAHLKFLRRVEAWEQRFGPQIALSTDRGWVFTDLTNARKMLLKALPDLFLFLHNTKIARSTNALEGYFSRLKEHYRRHRGLSSRHRDAYFRWYFQLVTR